MASFGAGLAAGQDDDGKLQAFGFVDAHDAHGVEVFFGEHAFAFVLDVEDALFELADRLFERGQSFAAELFGLLAQLGQVGHRLLAVEMAGGEQLHRQSGKYPIDGGADGQGSGFYVEPGQRLIELGERRGKLFHVEFGGVAIVEPVLPVQLVNLQIGEPAQGRAQHADQGQAVVRVLHRAQ